MKTVAPGTPVASGSPQPAIEVRDLLADLAEVIDGPDRVRLADIPARLRKLAPSYRDYIGLTGVQLREMLKREDVRVLTTGGILWLDPPDLRSADASREAE
jgi:S-DNA-T family DNA segregation ATPase FtsK/SpoIIIE